MADPVSADAASIAMELRPIGSIRTPYRRLGDCPANLGSAGDPVTIELYPEYADGLSSVEAASHLIVLYWLDAAHRDRLRAVSRADGRVRGVFANRSPARPNPIGIGIVRLLGREGLLLTVSGLDCLDGTPLLDLKPYLPWLDAIPDATVAWR
jgi:tRNA-Thr(GGU) m(6)t(6)A37 methyltransferase TsaA